MTTQAEAKLLMPTEIKTDDIQTIGDAIKYLQQFDENKKMIAVGAEFSRDDGSIDEMLLTGIGL